MSVKDEIDRIKAAVASAFSAVTSKGGTVGSTGVDDLTDAIMSIPSGGSPSIGEWSSAVYLLGNSTSGGIFYRYNRDTREVTLDMYYYTPTGTGQKDNVAQIPAEFRPKGACGGALAVNGSNYNGTWGCKTDGYVWYNVRSASGRWYGHISWGY